MIDTTEGRTGGESPSGSPSCSSLLRLTGRVLSRFSCGAASAVATKLAIEKYGEAVEIYYNDTGSEHEDNARFMRDCEAWFGRKVNVLRSEKFANIWEVFEKRRFQRGAVDSQQFAAIFPADDQAYRRAFAAIYE